MESINYLYHKFAGYVLFPIRLITYISSTLGIIAINVVLDKLQLNSDNLFCKLSLGYSNFCIRLFGIRIIKQGETISDDPCIIISNHINLYDHYVMAHIQNKVPIFIANDKYNKYPISNLLTYTKSILCSQTKKSGTVQKIKTRLSEGDQVTMYPDACDYIPQDKLIAPFRNGAFVPKAPIQPIVFRYVSSSTTNLNWNDNSLWSILLSYLMDGDIQCYVNILPLQTYNSSYKSHEDYKDHVYNLMDKELKLLPKQQTLIVTGNPSTKYTMKALLFLLGLGFFMYLIGNITISCSIFMNFILGYFCHFYPTKNTCMLDTLVVSYSTIKIYFISIQNFYDLCIRFVIIGLFGLCIRNWIKKPYSEKRHIHYLWIPGYLLGIYPMIVNTLELYNLI